MDLRRANPHRGLWAVLIPQDIEPVATRDDVDYLVRLDGSPLKPSAVEQLREVAEEYEAFSARAPVPVVEVVPNAVIFLEMCTSQVVLMSLPVYVYPVPAHVVSLGSMVVTYLSRFVVAGTVCAGPLPLLLATTPLPRKAQQCRYCLRPPPLPR